MLLFVCEFAWYEHARLELICTLLSAAHPLVIDLDARGCQAVAPYTSASQQCLFASPCCKSTPLTGSRTAHITLALALSPLSSFLCFFSPAVVACLPARSDGPLLARSPGRLRPVALGWVACLCISCAPHHTHTHTHTHTHDDDAAAGGNAQRPRYRMPRTVQHDGAGPAGVLGGPRGGAAEHTVDIQSVQRRYVHPSL